MMIPRPSEGRDYPNREGTYDPWRAAYWRLLNTFTREEDGALMTPPCNVCGQAADYLWGGKFWCATHKMEEFVDG